MEDCGNTATLYAKTMHIQKKRKNIKLALEKREIKNITDEQYIWKYLKCGVSKFLKMSSAGKETSEEKQTDKELYIFKRNTFSTKKQCL